MRSRPAPLFCAMSPPVNRELRRVLSELNQLVEPAQHEGHAAAARGGVSPRVAISLEWVAPAQTVCNLFNYWFTNFPGAL